MFEFIFTLINDDYLIRHISIFLFLPLSGILIRFILLKTDQHWAFTYTQTSTFMILPVTAYVVSIAISGNLALSLGMVGALSIVRFRHPVRSPLELVIYFTLITLGITSSVALKYAIALLFVTLIILFSIYFINNLYLKYTNKAFYGISFGDANSLSTLELESINQIPELLDDPNFISFSNVNETNIYRLAASNPNLLKEISKKYINDDNIRNIQLLIS